MKKLVLKILTFVLFVSFNLLGNSSASFANAKDMKLLIPAYFHPADSNYWSTLINQALKMPNKICAVANIDNGPGDVISAEYTNVFINFRANGGKVVGYVDSNYTKNSLEDVYEKVDTWYSNYNIDGIFVDCQSNTKGFESYYVQLYKYIKNKYPNGLVVTNPGTHSIETYINYNGETTSDVMNIYENFGNYNQWVITPWCVNYSSDRFSILPYKITKDNFKDAIHRASINNVSWFFTTDAPKQNVWGALATYFDEMCDHIKENYTTYASSLYLEIGNPNMKVNNSTSKKIDPGFDSKPIIINGRTLVPFRFIIEEMGGKADWDSKKFIATFTKNNVKIQLNLTNKERAQKDLYVGLSRFVNDIVYNISSVIKINNLEYQYETSAINYKGRVYVPLRFVSENLGSLVRWNPSNESITISYNK